MSAGRLKRVWVPKRGQPVQPDIVFTLIGPPPESSASSSTKPPATAPPKTSATTSPSTTPAEALAVLRDAQRPSAERIRTLELITQQGAFAVPPLAEVLIAEVDLARQSRDQVHASGRDSGFSDILSWELRRDMASGLQRAAGSDEKAMVLAACVLAWTDWRDPYPGGVGAYQWLPEGDLQTLLPKIKPLFSHPSSAVRAGAMRLFVRQPQFAPLVAPEVWDCFAKAPPVEKIAAAYVLLEAEHHVADVLNELLPLMQNQDASLAEEAARALPTQGKPAETSARFLRDAFKVPALRPLALKTLCNVWTKDETIKQDLFRAALVDPLAEGKGFSYAFFNGASKDGVQPLVEALTSDNVNTRRRAAALVENGYLMPFMNLESWMTMKSRLPALTPTFLPALQHAVDDTDAEVRCRAANTLALIGKDAAAAAPTLARLLSDPERAVRWAAAWAMEKCSPGTASAECAKAIADRPTATGPAGDKLTLIGYDPPLLPPTLQAGTTFRVRVAYEMKSVPRCFVFGTPLLNGNRMMGGSTNGSPSFSQATGEARLEAYNPRDGGKMDQFRVYLSADTGKTKLVEIIFDTPTTWVPLAGKKP